MPSKDAPKGKKQPPDFNPVVAFYIFSATHLLSALYAPIQDCDEIFNYFEPSHYLNHGYGLQTWEYSPDYAIRSWTYAGFHALTAGVARLYPGTNKTTQFYFLRCMLAFLCASCETRLFSTIARTLNPRIAVFFLIAVVFSPGMFHASTAYLPSSFTMYTSMLGLSAFMDWRGGLRTASGITWFGIGAILGWPFSGVLILPFIVEEIILAAVTKSTTETYQRFVYGFFRSLLVLGFGVAVDSFFYRKFVCVPLNIVLYNVFSGPGRGPEIYGVEPWHFYIRNLALNFNVWFVLAVFALPLLIGNYMLRRQSVPKQNILRGVVFTSPFYLWLAIFTLQPHKEERFMYPAYPFLAVNSAVALHVVLAHLGSTDPKDILSKIPAKIKLGLAGILVFGAINVGIWRALGMVTAYSAPLKVYEPLWQNASAGDTVCLGKEWYRFPSSFFLPKGVRAKFVKSAFTGLLPGEFSEASGFGFFPGAWLIPAGMNDENREDPGKYTEVERCTFMVDSALPSWTPSELEPNYIADTANWEALKCEKFLDAAQTSTLGRLGWVPDLPIIPEKYRRRWGDYCLLRRKTRSSEAESQSDAGPLQSLVAQGGGGMLMHGRVSLPHAKRARSKLLAQQTPRFLMQQQNPVSTYHDNMEVVKLSLRRACDSPHVQVVSQAFHDSVHLQNPKSVVYGLLGLATVLWGAAVLVGRRKKKSSAKASRSPSPDLEKPASRSKGGKERPYGVWIPSDFKRPAATPYPNWSVTETKPLPYRPFRYGPKYNITMGLRSLQWDDWIELDNHYLKYHATKAARLAERGSRCYHTAPEAWDGAVELLEELCSYLPQRYPSLFERTATGMRNLATGEDVNCVERPLKEDPMALCARQVQDDLAIMFERPDGQYYLLAGAILLAGFWRLEDKLGMPLSEIHTSGNVPGFKEKLEKGMMNFFRRVQPDAPVVRNNYFIQVDDDLAWSHSIGDEDGPEGTVGWFTAQKDKAIEHHWFRSERQSLRRLPRSGGVVFTIRTYFHPITDIANEPYVPGRLASAIRSWDQTTQIYKGRDRYEKVLLEYLDKKHAEQVANGLDLSKEDEVRCYPY
ncbi:Alg9-like mannosyltransferase family-domain-containing protein [Phyllosticta paracitricarpa]|uniref:Mannosyltransferase n=1 Tax=Phyllosticta paracitricarpa TaxID=2016321 RepID=A0ABR1NKV4_9PEZI